MTDLITMPQLLSEKCKVLVKREFSLTLSRPAILMPFHQLSRAVIDPHAPLPNLCVRISSRALVNSHALSAFVHSHRLSYAHRAHA